MPIEHIDAGLPAAVDAEKTILGAILLDNAAHPEAAEKIEADDFSLDSHRRIFVRMTELMNSQRAVDIVTLANELARNKEVESVGGVAYLASLTEGLPRRPVIEEYIKIVKDKSLLRRLMAISSAAIARAVDQVEPAQQIFADVNDQILQASSQNVGHGQQIADFIADEAMAFEAEADAEPGGTLGALLLTPEINRVTSGLMESELCLLTGRPGSGKTEGGLQIALANARRGLRVHFQSLEMGKRQLSRRLWRLMARVPISAMRDPRCLTPDQRRAIRMAQEELVDLPFFIDDTHELTVSAFRSRAILAAKRWNPHPSGQNPQ